MNLIDFVKRFPDEASCKEHLRSEREKYGLRCPKCQNESHYWKKDKECWECKKCGRRTSLKSGTMMHYSKLPLQYWYIVMHLLSSTKKSFSALEIQRQLGHKYYEPIWTLVHKVRKGMGKRDALYLLEGELEIDEGFFTTFTIENKTDTEESEVLAETDENQQDKNSNNKRGRGSERKSTVLVIAESVKVDARQHTKNRPDRKVNHIKMVLIPDTKKETILEAVGKRVSNRAEAITDGCKSYAALEAEIQKVKQVVAKGAESCKVLPWVHICISNAKRWFLGIHHALSSVYFQNYLDEFAYNFNRRYMQQEFFDRLIISSIHSKNDFKPKFR